jgi:CRISPR/Cas system-associated protein Cas5 (RAMP superfamily)
MGSSDDFIIKIYHSSKKKKKKKRKEKKEKILRNNPNLPEIQVLLLVHVMTHNNVLIFQKKLHLKHTNDFHQPKLKQMEQKLVDILLW